MTARNHPCPLAVVNRARGFSMIVVLIILSVLSLIGVAVTQMTMLSERSTRYDRDWQIAWQAAEAALLDAEFDIRGPNTSGNSRVAQFSPTSVLGFSAGCGQGVADRGLCLPAMAGKPVWYTVDFTDTSANRKSVEFGDFTGRQLDVGTGVRPARKPRYIIEVLPDLTPGGSATVQRNIYRVTAIGFGPREDTQAVLQMFFRKE